jgi:tetratricopeptide (TPR) repeat protein
MLNPMLLIRRYIESVICLIFFFLLTLALYPTPPITSSGETKFLSPPPEYLEYFTFGFQDSVADSLWIRWIQDNDTCVQYAGMEVAEPIRGQQSEFANPRHKICDNSWSFKMLDVITKTAPRFKIPYEAGAVTLSVLVEDYEGAKVIFDRGVMQFPEDWSILYRAAYHYLYDRNDYQRAAELLSQASDHGAPEWLKLLAARLYSKSGQIELGLSNLLTYRESIKDKSNEAAIAHVDKRIAELQQKLKEQQAHPPEPPPDHKGP